METKYKTLIDLLRSFKRVAIAFSGGVDSAFLLAAAKEALGKDALAVIGRSPTYPEREYTAAKALAESIGVPYAVIDTDEIENPAFSSNPPSRCYVCKTTLFTGIREVAQQRDIDVLLEGSNADDAGDFRPGMAAAKKLGARAPLLELGFTKDEIRRLSKDMGLPTWNKPAMACLSSRIPYGEEISEPKLRRIEAAENAIRDMGIAEVRVRDHGSVARIEVNPDQIGTLAGPGRHQLVTAVKEAGYTYVCLDLEGYRTGAMNEMLSDTDPTSIEIKGDSA